ncbi:MAG TPA: glycosyltransferase family 4 protein [Solirubrobacteraceae bacterium]|nr:glycosyltransferase family 4 protein [Solirubrobacteraceae bacterium]
MRGKALKVAVYCDFSYRIDGDAVYAEVSFIRFIEGLAAHCERLVVVGRLAPARERFPYRLRAAEFVPLPYYRSGADLAAVLRTIPAAIRRFWRVLDDVDVVWILGPNPPQAPLFAILGILRRRKVVLGVRQNLPELIRHRRRGEPVVICSAHLLERLFRLLSRFVPVVVVGADLARRYRSAKSILGLYVSLLSESDLIGHDDRRRYDGDELVALSVGRLDQEKNPLLLVDVLECALEADPRWSLHVCGDGVLAGALAERAARVGVGDRLVQHGYVPIDSGLWDLYMHAHVLLHVSMTEGAPQVILEAFAARLPVVATAVGGVRDLVAHRGLLVPPGDPAAAAAALARMVADPGLRSRVVEAGHRTAADHTLQAECRRLAAFLSATPTAEPRLG